MAKHVVILVGISLLAGIPCPAAIITVDPNGSADYTTIQAGIDDANDGDTVIVADGTYTGTGNRDIDFLGKAITVKSANGPENCIINCQGSWSSPHRGFYFHSGEDPNSVLDGFTISHGSSQENGGAIYCYESSPTITNCTIRENHTHLKGGGIGLDNSGAVIANCTITNNEAFFYFVWASPGGGISCDDGSTVTISNCTISYNDGSRGGGLYSSDSSPTISKCIFVNNIAHEWEDDEGSFYAGYGGAIYFSNCDGTITNCTISNNIADYSGGGLH